MTDQKETAATMWQDEHGGKRGHQLMTQKLADTIPALGANENARDYDEVLAPANLFSLYSNWTWYITEMDPVTGQCFGLVEGFEKEIGYFDLTELAETTVFGGVPAVERDLYWQPMTLGEIKSGSPGDSPQSEQSNEGETMTGETGTQDVVNVEEFLFGHATGDAPADVGGEPPAADATDDAGWETAEEADDERETAVAEPETADDAGDQPAPAEPETSEELKVVLSIRAGRATIGVQRPSADPHIESFDDPGLFGLADEFPAVVARARAKWEGEPMHPAYVKPLPRPGSGTGASRERPRPPRTKRSGWCCSCGRLGAAQAATDEAEAEQQPETLRLF